MGAKEIGSGTVSQSLSYVMSRGQPWEIPGRIVSCRSVAQILGQLSNDGIDGRVTCTSFLRINITIISIVIRLITIITMIFDFRRPKRLTKYRYLIAFTVIEECPTFVVKEGQRFKMKWFDNPRERLTVLCCVEHVWPQCDPDHRTCSTACSLVLREVLGDEHSKTSFRSGCHVLSHP